MRILEAQGHKVSKDKAKYGGGSKRARCSVCIRFDPPNSCDYVSGTINPHARCMLFEPEKDN